MQLHDRTLKPSQTWYRYRLQRFSSLMMIALCTLAISGCASKKAEVEWQQGKQTLESQLIEIGNNQALLAQQVQVLSERLSDLESQLASHLSERQVSSEQNEARFLSLENGIKTLQTTAAKARKAAARKNKAQNKSKKAKMVAIKKAKRTQPIKQIPVVSEEEIKRSYINAYLALKSGQYEQASKDFNHFLKEFPASKYAHQAEYWLGETLHAQGNTLQALEAFQKAASAREHHPQTNAALLRLGQLFSELGRAEQAKTTFQNLIEKQPQSPEAEIARKALSKPGAATNK